MAPCSKYGAVVLLTPHLCGGSGAMEPVQPWAVWVKLNDAPPLAVLNSDNAAWPDSLNIDYRPKGYELDKQGYPTFKYIAAGLAVDDKVSPSPDGKVLTRRVTFNGTAQGKFILSCGGCKKY